MLYHVSYKASWFLLLCVSNCRQLFAISIEHCMCFNSGVCCGAAPALSSRTPDLNSRFNPRFEVQGLLLSFYKYFHISRSLSAFTLKEKSTCTKAAVAFWGKCRQLYLFFFSFLSVTYNSALKTFPWRLHCSSRLVNTRLTTHMMEEQMLEAPSWWSNTQEPPV